MLRPEIPEEYPELEAANTELRLAATELNEASQRYHQAIVGRMAVLASIRNQT